MPESSHSSYNTIFHIGKVFVCMCAFFCVCVLVQILLVTWVIKFIEFTTVEHGILWEHNPSIGKDSMHLITWSILPGNVNRVKGLSFMVVSPLISTMLFIQKHGY
jgi:hypothetical protein